MTDPKLAAQASAQAAPAPVPPPPPPAAGRTGEATRILRAQTVILMLVVVAGADRVVETVVAAWWPITVSFAQSAGILEESHWLRDESRDRHGRSGGEQGAAIS